MVWIVYNILLPMKISFYRIGCVFWVNACFGLTVWHNHKPVELPDSKGCTSAYIQQQCIECAHSNQVGEILTELKNCPQYMNLGIRHLIMIKMIV